MEEQITMSVKETERVAIIEKVITGQRKQKHGAKELDISVRQIRRIIKRYKREGLKGLRHKLRGKISNNKMSQEQEAKIIEIIAKKYYDFGPTFAKEKLLEAEGIKISKEKLRQIMIREHLWTPKKIKTRELHQMRERRSREGELVQIDGSPHAWFEDRGENCCLIVFIDDATSKIKWLHFCEKETTNDYFTATKFYINKYGLAMAFYSDKHGIFKINTKELNSKAIDETKGLTQFGRAMKELKIELINANSPQAKGRVERANQTLQDRLVKELRLAGISAIEEANLFVSEFIEKYNKKFAVVPKSKDNAHRKLPDNVNLDIILKKQETKTISKNLIVQYNNKFYQIQTKKPVYAMKKQKVTVIENNIGEIEIIYKGNKLAWTLFEKQPKTNIVLDSKELNIFLNNICKQPVKKKKIYIPDKNHPWRNHSKKRELQTC